MGMTNQQPRSEEKISFIRSYNKTFQTANWFGSITQASTMCLGTAPDGSDVHLPFHSILPMVRPDDIIFDGWDISSFNLADSMERAQVLDYNLQVRLIKHNKNC